MNLLYTVKSYSQRYNLIASSLYDTETSEPITDIEGMTALLTTDGTSWELVNDAWEQIDVDIDNIILNSVYPFLMSVSNSIYNDFVNTCFTKTYGSLTIVQNAETSYFYDINLGEATTLAVEDFIGLVTSANKYVTKIEKITDNTITIDGRGLNIRATGAAEQIGIFLISYPPDFFATVLKMLAFDLFEREDKEKRQEKLGSYTYTNFEPMQYYGDGSYPKHLQKIIDYWQYIHV